jgi:hypothetical protein
MSFASRGRRGASIDQARACLSLLSQPQIGDDTTTLAGRTLADHRSLLGPTTLHILFFGQSNNNNVVLPGPYTILNPTKILNMSIQHRGAVFYAKEPILASDSVHSHNGLQLADQLIAAGAAENVIVSNISTGGTFGADWVRGGATAGVGFRRGEAANRIGLAQRCIVAAGLDGVRTVIDWAIGEWDSDAPASSQAQYQSAMAAVVAETKSCGLLRPGRVMFLHKTTRPGNLQSSRDAIRAGVDTLVDGALVRAGVDMDAIGNRTDGTHFNLTGAATLATGKKALIQNWIANG